MGLRNIDPKLADKEDVQQNYYQNIVRDRSIALSNKESAEYNKNFQEQKLEDLDRLDLFKCKDPTFAEFYLVLAHLLNVSII